MAIFTAAAAAISSFIAGISLSSVAAFAVRTMLTIGISKLVANRANKRASGAQDSGARIQLAPATNNKLPVIYGKAYIAPVITDAKISTDQKTMWYVCALSEVTDTGSFTFGDIYYDGKLVTFDNIDTTKVASLTTNSDPVQVDTKVAGNLYMYLFNNGSSSGVNTAQTAIQILQDSNIPVSYRWTSTDTMSNCAFIIVKINYNQDANTVNLGQLNVELTNSLTKPGDVLNDYLQNIRYGCSIPSSKIDSASITALNNYSDELITYTPVGGGSATQPRYRINGPVNTGQDCMSNLQDIIDSCDSWLQYSELTGQWKVVINKPYSGSLNNLYNVNDDILVGGIDITPIDLNNTYNSLEVQYPDNNVKDQTNFKVLELSDLLPSVLSPNEPNNRLVVQYPLVNNYIQSVYLGIRRLLQSREDLTITLITDYSGIQVEAGDVIRVNFTPYGWVDKLFRVSQVTEQKDESGFLSARITAFEYNATIYVDNAIQDFVPEANTGLSDPNVIGTPTAPTATIGTANALAIIQIAATVPSTGAVLSMDFNYGTNSNSASHLTYTTVSQADGSPYSPGAPVNIGITDLEANTYYFSVTARNQQAGARSLSSNAVVWQGPNIGNAVITSNNLANGAVIAGKIANGGVIANNIANGAVIANNLANGAVIAGSIANGAVLAGALANGSVILGTLANGVVVLGTVATNAIDTDNLVANSITANKVAANAITANSIAANAITAGKIDANAITAGTIAANAVTAGTIAANAVTANTVAANAITANSIAANAVTAGKIDANAVTAGTIAANAVTAGTIAAGAVTSNTMTANTINGNVITANTLFGNRIIANTVDGNVITANTVNGNVMIANTLYGNAIIANTVNGNVITANTLNGNTIIGNTINGNTIIANTINGNSIIANTISGNAITANTIDASKVQAFTLTAGQIASGTIDATRIAANTIVFENLAIGAVTQSKSSQSEPSISPQPFFNWPPSSSVWPANTRCIVPEGGVTIIPTTDPNYSANTEYVEGSRILVSFTVKIWSDNPSQNLVELWKSGAQSVYDRGFNTIRHAYNVAGSNANTATQTIHAYGYSPSGLDWISTDGGNSWSVFNANSTAATITGATTTYNVTGNSSPSLETLAVGYLQQEDVGNNLLPFGYRTSGNAAIVWEDYLGDYGLTYKTSTLGTPVTEYKNNFYAMEFMPHTGGNGKPFTTDTTASSDGMEQLIIGANGDIFWNIGGYNVAAIQEYGQGYGTAWARENYPNLLKNLYGCYANPQANVPLGSYTAVIVGQTGTLLRATRSKGSSSYANTWTSKPLTVASTNAAMITDLYGVAGDDTSTANSVWVAVGQYGMIQVSTNDAQDWNQVESPTTLNINAVRYCGNRWVAVGDQGLIMTASNAANANSWTINTSYNPSPDPQPDLNSIDYSYEYSRINIGGLGVILTANNSGNLTFTAPAGPDFGPSESYDLTRLTFFGSNPNVNDNTAGSNAQQINNGQVFSSTIVDTAYTANQETTYYLVIGNMGGNTVYAGQTYLQVQEIKR